MHFKRVSYIQNCQKQKVQILITITIAAAAALPVQQARLLQKYKVVNILQHVVVCGVVLVLVDYHRHYLCHYLFHCH